MPENFGYRCGPAPQAARLVPDDARQSLPGPCAQAGQEKQRGLFPRSERLGPALLPAAQPPVDSGRRILIHASERGFLDADEAA